MANPTQDANQDFDQAAWQRATSWPDDSPPTAVEAWRLFGGEEMPEPIRAAAKVASAATSMNLMKKGRREEEAGISGGAMTRAESRSVWNNRFTNLLSGRFTEVIFARAYAPALSAVGLELLEETEQRNFLDFRVIQEDEEFDLAINVKNAGVQFQSAERFVGLAPADTLPIATYKIFGSEFAGAPALIYVYLVDWGLLQRLRRFFFFECLNESERRAFQLMANFKGIRKDLEDAFIESTVADRISSLAAGVGYDLGYLDEMPFRAVSGARCRQIFYENPGRSPYVYLTRMNTDPNTHLSVEADTKRFDVFIEEHLSSPDRRLDLIDGLKRVKLVEIPDPPV